MVLISIAAIARGAVCRRRRLGLGLLGERWYLLAETQQPQNPYYQVIDWPAARSRTATGKGRPRGVTQAAPDQNALIFSVLPLVEAEQPLRYYPIFPALQVHLPVRGYPRDLADLEQE